MAERRDGGPAARTVTLGRWAGVPVRMHWTAVVIVVLVSELLAVSVLPAARPHHASGSYWVAGACTAVLFMACILAHELSHCVSARHYRMKVRSVTLWMLGGVTDLGGEPPSPRAAAVIAGAGPAASLALGSALYAIALALPTGLIATSLAWLGSVNIVLAVFNLLPGAPLDGGHLLEAVLTLRYHDRSRAAASSARVGRMLGILIISLGTLELLAGYPLGLWLAAIGWFIMTSSGARTRTVRAEVLRGLSAGRIMTPAVAAPDWWTVTQFLQQLPDSAAAQLMHPLHDFAGRAAGLVGVSDLDAVPADQRDQRRLRDLAAGHHPAPLLIPADHDLGELGDDLLTLLRRGGIAVVTRDERPVGILTAADLMRATRVRGLQGDPARPDAAAPTLPR